MVGELLGSALLGKSRICGVVDTGQPNDDTAGIAKLRAEYGDLKYSADANYIIFRDIDLSANGENSDKKDGSWTPIHLSGKMEGRLNMQPGAVPTIRNVKVSRVVFSI